MLLNELDLPIHLLRRPLVCDGETDAEDIFPNPGHDFQCVEGAIGPRATSTDRKDAPSEGMQLLDILLQLEHAVGIVIGKLLPVQELHVWHNDLHVVYLNTGPNIEILPKMTSWRGQGPCQ
jgi:hypothetical protein